MAEKCSICNNEIDIEIIPNIFQDIYENQIHTIIYTSESEETELSELGR